MHPGDAACAGLADGDRAVVRSRVGAIDVESRVSDEVMRASSACRTAGARVSDQSQCREPRSRARYNALIDGSVIEPISGMSFLNGFSGRSREAGRRMTRRASTKTSCVGDRGPRRSARCSASEVGRSRRTAWRSACRFGTT